MLKAPSRLANRSLLHLTRPSARLQWRHSSTTGGGRAPRRTNRPVLFSSGAVMLALGLSPWYMTQVHADAAMHSEAESDDAGDSLGALFRSYAVYTMCSIPALVDYSPKLLELGSIPGLKGITEALVRITFFDQFVGGDTAQKTVPLLHALRAANKGALFAYSVEVDEAEATAASTKHKEHPPHKRIVDEMIRCIDVAADFEDSIAGKVHGGRRTWVAVKITALLPDAHALIRLSSHVLNTRPRLAIAFPGCPHPSDLDVLESGPTATVTAEDVAAIRDLHSDLVRICTRAQERGVKIIIDAEYSWYQPALDALTLSLMRRFNKLDSAETSKVQPLVYGTYQAYLQRTPAHLAQSFADAKAHNYALGVKLVRGAYHPHEVAAHAGVSDKRSLSISPDAHPPVWMSKAETDRCYDACARVLLAAIKDDLASASESKSNRGPATPPPTVGVLFGTHNWASCGLILDELVSSGLAHKGERDQVVLGDDVTERLTIGQLYGMSDELTNHLVHKTSSNTPLIIKYVPYGALSEVMPYLSRRAIENKSVLGDGGAAVERRRAGAEIRKRLFGWWFAK